VPWRSGSGIWPMPLRVAAPREIRQKAFQLLWAKWQSAWTRSSIFNPSLIFAALNTETTDDPQTLLCLAPVCRTQLLLATRLAKSGVPAQFIEHSVPVLRFPTNSSRNLCAPRGVSGPGIAVEYSIADCRFPRHLHEYDEFDALLDACHLRYKNYINQLFK